MAIHGEATTLIHRHTIHYSQFTGSDCETLLSTVAVLPQPSHDLLLGWDSVKILGGDIILLTTPLPSILRNLLCTQSRLRTCVR